MTPAIMIDGSVPTNTGHGVTIPCPEAREGTAAFTISGAVPSSAAIDFSLVAPGIWDSTIEAITPGAGGNAITITVASDGVGGMPTISRSGSDFTIHIKALTGASVSQIEQVIGSLTGADKLIRARYMGTPGNQVTAGIVRQTMTGGGAVDLTAGLEVSADGSHWAALSPVHVTQGDAIVATAPQQLCWNFARGAVVCTSGTGGSITLSLALRS